MKFSIMMFRINTAETLSAARRSRASTSADLDHAASQHIKEPNDRCMLIMNRGVPGLVDRVTQTPIGGRCPNDFSVGSLSVRQP